MLVEVWSDIVCPWCYIGKRRLERALATFPRRDEVEVRLRSFELDPSPTADTGETLERMLAEKYRVSLDQARGMNDRVTMLAAEEGLGFRLDIARPGNTFDAHRLAHHARALGLEAELMERLQAAYFCEGAPVGDHETLLRLAGEVGIDRASAREVLQSERFADDVRGEETLASRLGIRGVPFFVLDRRLGVSGAQDAGTLRDALDQAFASLTADAAATH
ncbi:MAG: DsbA family oxidoreductase [Chloroflexota bacterium]